GAGFLLERRARFLIFPQLAAIFGDRLRRCRLGHGVGRRRGESDGIHGQRLRRNQQQREREKPEAETNRHRFVVASVACKSAPKRLDNDWSIASATRERRLPLPLGEGWGEGLRSIVRS